MFLLLVYILAITRKVSWHISHSSKLCVIIFQMLSRSRVWLAIQSRWRSSKYTTHLTVSLTSGWFFTSKCVAFADKVHFGFFYDCSKQLAASAVLEYPRFIHSTDKERLRKHATLTISACRKTKLSSPGHSVLHESARARGGGAADAQFAALERVMIRAVEVCQ